MWDDFILFVAVGFAAQLVDGAIGMAYGLSATTVMLSLGFPPATATATATASVHAAEVFTAGISGLAHWRFGNVDWTFVRRLAVPGVVGGAVGAYDAGPQGGRQTTFTFYRPTPEGLEFVRLLHDARDLKAILEDEL